MVNVLLFGTDGLKRIGLTLICGDFNIMKKPTCAKAVFLFLSLLFAFSEVFAQDSHYNSQQPDSKGILNGGTGVAGSRELSAIFYNPGIVSFFEKSNLGLSGNLYAYDYVKLQNEDQQAENNLVGSYFQSIPSLFAGTFKWKKNPNITTSYIYFNNGFYINRLKSFGEQAVNVNNDDYILYSRYDVRNRYSDDWVGGGLSYKVNDHIGIGLVSFFQFFTQNYIQRSYTEFARPAMPELIEQAYIDYRETNLFNVGVSFDFGIVYSTGEHEFGLSLITPNISLTGLSFSALERQLQSFTSDSVSYSSLLLDSDFLAKVKRPLQINIGYAWMLENRSLKFRLSYYSRIAPYVMGRQSSETVRKGIFEHDDQYDYLPVSMNNSVINFGIGYEWRVHEKLKLVSGFRTDFTFMDKSQFKFLDFTNTLVTWNLYHLSAGIDWKHKWLQLNTGLDYAFSYDKGISNFFNPEDVSRPINEVNLSDDAYVNHQQIKAFLGLVLSF